MVIGMHWFIMEAEFWSVRLPLSRDDFYQKFKKSRMRETLNLSNDADRSTCNLKKICLVALKWRWRAVEVLLKFCWRNIKIPLECCLYPPPQKKKIYKKKIKKNKPTWTREEKNVWSKANIMNMTFYQKVSGHPEVGVSRWQRQTDTQKDMATLWPTRPSGVGEKHLTQILY